jgi:DNA-binding LacI/PurR family transcriptional regulator
MNLGEVARRAGVSIATASRVMNGSKDVSGKTRKLVEAKIQELRYLPNSHARSLAGAKSHTVGVILANAENPFFFDVYRSFNRQAAAAGYEVILTNAAYRRARVEAGIRSMICQKVAGLATFAPDVQQSLIDGLRESGIPTITVDGAVRYRAVKNIGINYRRGMEKVAMHLYALGHRRIGVVGYETDGESERSRLGSALAAFAAFPDVVAIRAISDDSLDGGRAAAAALLSQDMSLTALVCVNDFMAAGAAREVRERGLGVPQQISITGFDDIELARFCYPALTTVGASHDRLGEEIWSCLMTQPALPDSDILIETELVVRDSTGLARQT